MEYSSPAVNGGCGAVRGASRAEENRPTTSSTSSSTSSSDGTLVPEFAARGLGKALTQVVTAIGADRLHDILQYIYITKWEGQKWTRRG